MKEPVKAWQPLTFGGVARYGHDWVGRIFFACLVVSILTGSTVIWAVTRTWFPVIEEAITRLPIGAVIRGGRLTAPQPVQLAENLFLALRLDPVGEGAPPSLADVQIVFAPYEIRFRSLFGAAALPYRPEWTVQLSQADFGPKWDAWRPAMLANLFFGTVVALFLSWIALGILYSIPVWILALLLKRSISLWGSWKLSVAGLLPGAILMTVAIGVYALGQVRATELIIAWIVHFIVGWIFIIGATVRLPRRQKTKPNPFGGHLSEDDLEEEEEDRPAKKNPFNSKAVSKKK